jgi:hypothetical protein
MSNMTSYFFDRDPGPDYEPETVDCDSCARVTAPKWVKTWFYGTKVQVKVCSHDDCGSHLEPAAGEDEQASERRQMGITF